MLIYVHTCSKIVNGIKCEPSLNDRMEVRTIDVKYNCIKRLHIIIIVLFYFLAITLP